MRDYPVKQDLISITLTVLAGAIFIYASTWGAEYMPTVLILMCMMTFGLVMNLLVFGGSKVEAGERGLSWKTTLFYTMLGLGAIILINYFAAKIPIFALVPAQNLDILDTRFLLQLVAVAEEQFFRGFMTPYFARYVGFFPGITLSAGFFTVYHFAVYQTNPTALVVVFFGGLVLSFISLKTKRLSPSLLAHVINNSFAV
jgi:membrane protease YdiL (CAAX protease family)